MIPRRKIEKILVLIAIGLIIVLGKYFLIPGIPEKKAELLWVEGKVPLPPPRYSSTTSVEEAISRRRSVREYQDRDLDLEDLSQLLWAAQGITLPKKGFRSAPSAGALYPLEFYVVTGEGIFHYAPFEHALELMHKGDVRVELAKAAVDQEWVREAPASIVIAGVFERTTQKYGLRGERYVYMEAGHVAQNIYLQAESLNLGTVVVGAFYDEEVQKLLKLPEDHRPLYIMPVGYKLG